MVQEAKTRSTSDATVRINCGVDYKAHQGFGAYSAMIKVGDEQLAPIAGVMDEGATFIRCCLMAAVSGFEAVNSRGESVEVVTPSTWLAETAGDSENLANLQANNWVKEDGKEIVHRDLLERLVASIDRHATVSWVLAKDVGQKKRAKEDADRDEASADQIAPDCHISYAATTIGNSGVGAYYIELEIPGRVEKVSSKFQTTNFARMHLTACIDALREARRILRKDGLRIILDTPHDLTANAVNRGWLDAWAQNKWNRREGDRVRNADLWQEFRRHINRHDVEVRLAIDSGDYDEMLTQAQRLAQREIDQVREDKEFKEQEEAAVKAGTLIRIFVDGSVLENPGPGGWGAIMEVKGKKASQSKGYLRTTNNRMELMGAAVSLDFLVKLKEEEKIDANTKVVVITDSQYLVSAMTRGWAKRWRKNQWIKQDGEKAKNTDLWKRILHASDRLKTVDFRWVRGHARYREAFTAENEMCDRLAKQAAGRPEDELLVDAEYER
jgi:ribonuclease HI